MASHGVLYTLYKENLADLVSPDRGSIGSFYEIARDHVGNPGLAACIAEAIVDHLQETTPGQKLPALYVLDMIAKNQDTKLTFRGLFERSRLPQVVAKAWMDVCGLPDVLLKFQRVVATWRAMSTFSSAFLDRVDAGLDKCKLRAAPASAVSWTPSLPAGAAQLPTDPRRRPQAAAAQEHGVSPARQQSAYVLAPAPHPGALPQAVLAQLPGAAVNGSSSVTPAAMLGFASLPPAAPRPLPLAVPHGYTANPVGALVQMPVLASVNSVVSTASGSAAATVAPAGPGGAASADAGRVFPVVVGVAAAGNTVASASPQAATASTIQPTAAAVSSAAPINVVQLLTSTPQASAVGLAQVLPLGAAPGVLQTSGPAASALGQQGPAVVAAADSKPAAPRNAAVPVAGAVPAGASRPGTGGASHDTGKTSTLDILSGIYQLFKAAEPAAPVDEDGAEWSSAEFPAASKLKAHQQLVVEELMEHSKRTRPKLLDLQFRKNSRKRSQGSMSRQWFVTADSWLSGTTAASEAPPVFFADQSEQSGTTDPTVHRQLRDDTKKVCAISGEPFDMVFDSVTERWWFTNCVQLDGPDATVYGVPPGSYVKASAITSGQDQPVEIAPMPVSSTPDAEAAADGPAAPGTTRAGDTESLPCTDIDTNHEMAAASQTFVAEQMVGMKRPESVVGGGLQTVSKKIRV